MFSNIDDIVKIWNNLSEVEQFEILAFVSALLTNNRQVTPQMKELLNGRLEKFDENTAVSWGQLYNRLLEELI